MPFEIPGVPLEKLPDRRSIGVCPSCQRSYRSLKIFRLPDGSMRLVCPFCGQRIADIEGSIRLDEAKRDYQNWLDALDAEKQRSVSELEEERDKRLNELTSLHGEVMLTVANSSLLFRLLSMLREQTTATYEARVVRELKFVELSTGQIRGALDRYKELEIKRANARRMAIIVPIVVLVLVVALIIWGMFPSGPTVNDVIPIIQIPLPVFVWSVIGSIIAIPYRFNKSGDMELQDPLRWVFTRPLTGMVMGILAYYILRAGFITIAAETQNSINSDSANFGLMLIYWLVAFIGGFSDRFADGFLKVLIGRFGGDINANMVSLDQGQVPMAHFLNELAEGFPNLNNKQNSQVEEPNGKERGNQSNMTDVESETANSIKNER